MLFADVRGSTALAGERTISEYTTLIQKFYRVSSDILIRHDALVNRLMGDQVIGLFVPRLTGSNHAKRAVAAAIEILRATGHQEPDGPWIPVGVGVHSGEVYVGSVGSGDSVTEIAVLGDNANKAARLSSNAEPGELIVSEEAFASADLSGERLERRKLDLNGIREPVEVRVMRSDQGF
ncbi:MAG: adenylate/guanylate cyclase domain-containing protein [Chloroflexi bacterium]|nr:adenylate/guanylate cyclase domain-containing protein [Chloroflexota bacterium]